MVRLPADLRHGEPATDFARKGVGYLGVAWNYLYLACLGIALEGMCTTLAFEIATVPAQVTKQGFALHCTVTVS